MLQEAILSNPVCSPLYYEIFAATLTAGNIFVILHKIFFFEYLDLILGKIFQVRKLIIYKKTLF